MKGPRFSIMIPTRERARTLGPCIETCLAQKYENLEVLVSDNASSPETRDVVAGFKDPRLKYFRQESRVSMRQNFEFLANQATGDYLIFIGDDDGMMPGAVQTMSDYLSIHPVDVLNWTDSTYYWPGRLIDDRGFVTIKYQKIFGHLTLINPAERLKGFFSGQIPSYIYGCNLYHGCISRRVVDEVRSITGQVFSDHMPDVYACVAFLFAAKSIVHFDHPLSISGVSLASNGFSFFADKIGVVAGKNTPHQNFVSEAATDDGVVRRYNPTLRSSQYHCASGLIIANEFFGKKYDINLERWAKIIVTEGAKFCDLNAAIQDLNPDFELDKSIIDAIKSRKLRDNFETFKNFKTKPLKEKFNRMHIYPQSNGRDDVMMAYKLFERIIPNRKITSTNEVKRLVNWLALWQRRIHLPPFKGE